MKQIGDRPLTNAEKQRRFRERRKSQGLRRIQTWAGRDGFAGKPTDQGSYAQMSIRQFSAEIKNLTPDYEEWEREIVLAELLARAKTVIKRYNKVRQASQDMVTG
jgi:hypothetical protein